MLPISRDKVIYSLAAGNAPVLRCKSGDIEVYRETIRI